jgi:hypothetical protein
MALTNRKEEPGGYTLGQFAFAGKNGGRIYSYRRLGVRAKTTS